MFPQILRHEPRRCLEVSRIDKLRAISDGVDEFIYSSVSQRLLGLVQNIMDIDLREFST